MKAYWSILSVACYLILALAGCREPLEPEGERDAGETDGLAQSIGSSSLSPVADTYLKKGTPNKNQGDEEILRVRPDGKNRALIQFDQSAIDAAVGINVLESATLELIISHNANNWGSSGRTVDIHRLTQSWTELGATWNCANDSDTSNERPDCEGDDAWEMYKPSQPELHPWEENPTATVVITNGLTGTVTFDVTVDVQAFLAGEKVNNGWIIKRTEEGPSGSVEFASRETATPPQLILSFSSASVTDTIGPDGGTLALAGFATVTFPAGAFASPRLVTVETTSEPEERSVFKVSVGTGSAAREIRILAGSPAPAALVEVVLQVPQEFLNAVPSNKEPVIFSRGRYSSPIEVIDEYFLLQSEFSASSKTVRAEVPSGDFQEYEIGRGLQAVVVISSALVAGQSPSANSLARAGSQQTCFGQSLGLPLELPTLVQDTFSTRTPPGRDRPHRAIDYRARKGDRVLAALGGIVDSIGVDASAGQYIILKHNGDGDDRFTSYSHLVFGSPQALGLKKGNTVTQGQIIGLADDTGGSEGDHLHFVYKDTTFVNDTTFGEDRVDPDACIPSTAWGMISGGRSHTVAATFRGIPYAWGRNEYGQLGDNTLVDKLTPTQVFTSGSSAPNTAPDTVRWISAGRWHSCSIGARRERSGTNDHDRLFCWGRNHRGQLGDGARGIDRRAPTLVIGHPALFAMVSAGGLHTCGVEGNLEDLPQGTAYCWGRGSEGQLGDNRDFTLSDTSNAVVLVTNFATVSGGEFSTCGVTTNGVAYCWGEEFDDAPVEVSGPTNFVHVSAGENFKCGVTTDGLVYCWGDNHWGQVGINCQQDYCGQPTLVPTAPFRSVRAGRDHACGLTRKDGVAFCWGLNSDGQLGRFTPEVCGYPSRPCSREPVQVSGDHRFVSLGAGQAHTCGITVTGEAYCWGRNEFGQLGNNSTVSSWEPVPVNDPQ